MIFLRRLGIVLYWVAYALAILFAIVSLLIALKGRTSGGEAISGAWAYAVLGVVCWLSGRAIKYILTKIYAAKELPPPGRARAQGEIEMRRPTDPTKFKGLRPSAARALAEIIDNVDEAADPGALMGNCGFEIKLANVIAWQIEDGLGDAAELRTLGLPATLAKSIAEAINKSRSYPSPSVDRLPRAGDETKIEVRLLSRDVTLEDLGRIHGMLDLTNPAPARDQFNANYQHGGGWRPFDDKFTLGDDDSLGYPDDEPLHPLAEIRLRAERIIIYESNFVAIVRPDGSFEVCRMD
jgi:hypothetical protein